MWKPEHAPALASLSCQPFGDSPTWTSGRRAKSQPSQWNTTGTPHKKTERRLYKDELLDHATLFNPSDDISRACRQEVVEVVGDWHDELNSALEFEWLGSFSPETCAHLRHGELE
jgi:hypothetical protein